MKYKQEMMMARENRGEERNREMVTKRKKKGSRNEIKKGKRKRAETNKGRK